MKDKITGIVLAAGKGSRMKSDIAKQFMLLGEYPVVYYSLKAFENSAVDEVILVTNESAVDYCKKEIVEKYYLKKVKKVIAGGMERYDSVYRGIMEADAPDYVMIHDGARPFLTRKMIDDSIEAVKKNRACTVGVPVKDTIKIVNCNGFGVETPPREELWQIQTPQTFDYQLICESYQKMYADKKPEVTDDTMVVEKYGNVASKVIFGDYANIKITTPEDINLSAIFLKKFLTKDVDIKNRK